MLYLSYNAPIKTRHVNEMGARTSSATERALKRVAKGEAPARAAKAEGIALSTIYRALKRSVVQS